MDFPPHNRRLQSLNFAFFGPLKACYNQACNAFLVNHPGTAIFERNLEPLFSEAYGKATTVDNAIEGFKACVNPFIFAPAATTEHEDPHEVAKPPNKSVV